MYKAQRRVGIMLAYPFEEKRLLQWSPPWLVQPKLDGERCRCLIGSHGEVTLLSSEGNQILSVPHIEQEVANLGLPSGMELDGELYNHSLTFSEIHSRVSRKKEPHPQAEEIEYHIFDIVDADPQTERLVKLVTKITFWDKGVPHLFRVMPDIVHTQDQLMKLYDDYIKKGYEGFVVRNRMAPYLRRRSIWMMKFKPKQEDIYLITGSEEEVSIEGRPKGRLGALVVSSGIGDSGTFRVGTGFTDYEREELWSIRDTLKGKLARVKYQHLTDKGVPRFPVFISVIERDALSSSLSSGGVLQE